MQKTVSLPELPNARERLTDKFRYMAVLIGDRQREEVTAYLSLAYSQGFLLLAEFESRMSRALAARTEDQLLPVLRGLPESITTGEADPEPSAEPAPVSTAFAILVAAAIGICITCLVLVLATAAQHWRTQQQQQQLFQQQEYNSQVYQHGNYQPYPYPPAQGSTP